MNESPRWHLFFIEGGRGKGKHRWVIENKFGRTHDKDNRWKESFGWVRYEGIDFCPEKIGNQWRQYWDQNNIDKNIKITCAGKIQFQNIIGCFDSLWYFFQYSFYRFFIIYETFNSV